MVVPAPHTEWQCPTCGAPNTTAYCGHCGERRLEPSPTGLRNRLERLLRSAVDFDGRFWGSYRVLLRSPGELTAAYLGGRRQPFMGPLQLFLITNFVFFIVQSVTGVNVFSGSLANNLRGEPYSALANRLVTEHLAQLNMSVAGYAPFYNNMEQLLAKSLVVIMVPLFALAVLALSRPRESLAAHLTFATHFYVFLMVFLCAFFPVLSLSLQLLALFGWEPSNHNFDLVATGIEFIACSGYLYLATGRVYRLPWPHRAISAVLLTIGLYYILHTYRLVLFLVTLHAT